MKGRYNEAKIIILNMRKFNGSTNHDSQINFTEEKAYLEEEAKDEELDSLIEPYLNES
jgi:hypothetical protein